MAMGKLDPPDFRNAFNFNQLTFFIEVYSYGNSEFEYFARTSNRFLTTEISQFSLGMETNATFPPKLTKRINDLNTAPEWEEKYRPLGRDLS